MKRVGDFVYYPLEVLSIANGGESMIATTSLLYYMRDGTLVHRLAYNDDVVAFKMGRRQGGPSRTGV
jgi:hypothetical protein